MTLAFSEKFKDGTPTYFEEKLNIASANGKPFFLTDNGFECAIHPDKKRSKKNEDGSMTVDMICRKRHTIRQDHQDRWQPGTVVHAFYHARTSRQRRIWQGVCVSTQKIEIYYGHDNEDDNAVFVHIDGRVLDKHEVEVLAINDGFDSAEHFFEWFKEDFTGKLIHFTETRY